MHCLRVLSTETRNRCHITTPVFVLKDSSLAWSLTRTQESHLFSTSLLTILVFWGNHFFQNMRITIEACTFSVYNFISLIIKVASSSTPSGSLPHLKFNFDSITPTFSPSKTTHTYSTEISPSPTDRFTGTK